MNPRHPAFTLSDRLCSRTRRRSPWRPSSIVTVIVLGVQVPQPFLLRFPHLSRGGGPGRRGGRSRSRVVGMIRGRRRSAGRNRDGYHRIPISTTPVRVRTSTPSSVPGRSQRGSRTRSSLYPFPISDIRTIRSRPNDPAERRTCTCSSRGVSSTISSLLGPGRTKRTFSRCVLRHFGNASGMSRRRVVVRIYNVGFGVDEIGCTWCGTSMTSSRVKLQVTIPGQPCPSFPLSIFLATKANFKRSPSYHQSLPPRSFSSSSTRTKSTLR
jgi:hypothetical protein